MNIIKKPLLTEKYNSLGEKLNKYGFIVDKKATKVEIKNLVEKIFKVNIISINSMVYKGKPKTRYTKKNVINGSTSGYKKVIVTLKEGDKIDFYSNI
jgi:large subunit ribosomal protein L23